MVEPIWLGRFLARWAKMPVLGQLGLLRGWRAEKQIP